jgi:hypothetical protein
MSRRPLLFGLVGAVLGAIRGIFTDPAWLDSAFLSMRYARRISEHGTLKLLGQEVPVESYFNPLWTWLMAGLGVLGVDEMRMQPVVGGLLLSALVGLGSYVAALKFTRFESIVSVPLVLMAPPIATAAHSGSDHLFLTLLSLWAVFSVDRDQGRASASWSSMVGLVLLSMAGLIPLILAIVLAVSFGPSDRKPLAAVFIVTAFMSAFRWVIFDSIIPHGAVTSVMQGTPVAMMDGFKMMPLVFIIGAVGLIRLAKRESRGWTSLIAGCVWLVWAWRGGNGTESFGSSLVPALVFFGVGVGSLIDRLPKRVLGLVVMIGLVFIDGRAAEAEKETALKSRRSTLRQAKAMAQFLRWRFEKDPLVVVQTPGMMPYFLRKRTLDLQGITHKQPTDQQAIQALSPEAIVPEGAIVSSNPTRVFVKKNWDWNTLKQTHYQHSIMNTKDWKLIDVHPAWFNIYFRKDLEKYPPKWVKIYAEEERKRNQQKQNKSGRD